MVLGFFSRFEEIGRRKVIETTSTHRGDTEMKFSKKGEDILIGLEGFSPIVYADSAGHDTIGYGHKVKAGETFNQITKEQALNILRADISESQAESFINNYMPSLRQNQFDALVIFIFNIGKTAFLNSSVFQDIKDNKFEEATKPWAKWINITKKEKDPKTGQVVKKLIPVEGLIKRRAVEITLFNA